MGVAFCGLVVTLLQPELLTSPPKKMLYTVKSDMTAALEIG
jgi:hypothetical protein